MGMFDQHPKSQVAAMAAPRESHRTYWILAFLVFAFVALFLYTNRQRLRPAVLVTAERAVAAKVSAREMQSAASTQVLFQASGWIEPEPYMVKAASFVEGLVSEVFVLNGQVVRRGEMLATIDDKSLRLMIAEAQAELAAMEGEARVIAKRVEVATSEVSLVQEKQATAQAELARLERTSAILQRSGESLPLIQREDARLNVERQRKALQEVLSEYNLKKAFVEVVRAEEYALQQKIKSKNASLDRIRLDLERTVIRAPIEGIVQKVYVRSGQKVMLAGDSMDSATIADLYDPKRLQVRVDVALADAGGLEIGMPARVTTEILPSTQFAGTVTSIVGQADLAKNTLQAKVKLADPHWRLRPEMLARVEFLPLPKAAESPENKKPAQAMVHAYVPSASLKKMANGEAEVWVVSRDGASAEKRIAKLGEGERDGWREVRLGVYPGEWVILSSHAPLYEGCRISLQAQQRKEFP